MDQRYEETIKKYRMSNNDNDKNIDDEDDL